MSVWSQVDLWGKYKLSEPNGTNYEGFALFSDGEAVFLKVYQQKFLYHNELPTDSLTLHFNPGVEKVTEFPAELSLVQPIKATWKFEDDSLYLYEGDLKVVFRRFKTGWIVSESQISGFLHPEYLPMYYLFEGYDKKGDLNAKLKILDFNKDQIPNNYDRYDFYSEMPQIVKIKDESGSLIDSLYFSKGKGEKVITVQSKSCRGKKNEFSNYELNRKSLTGYYQTTIHGYQYLYYHPSEIEETYTGKKFLLKLESWYELGQKHGKWLYYDKKGNLIKTEVWKKDKLVKTID